MAEILALDQALASDDYWQGAYEQPNAPRRAHLEYVMDGMKAAYLMGQGALKRTQQLYGAAFWQGSVAERIPDGHPLTEPDEDSFIRIVQDRRQVYPKDSSRQMFERSGFNLVPEKFQEMVEVIEADPLYSQIDAQRILRELGPYRTVKIARSVGYLVGQRTNGLLVGLWSHQVTGKAKPFKDGVSLPTTIEVGQPYICNEDGTSTIKVVKAELVTTARAPRQKHALYPRISASPAFNI